MRNFPVLSGNKREQNHRWWAIRLLFGRRSNAGRAGGWRNVNYSWQLLFLFRAKEHTELVFAAARAFGVLNAKIMAVKAVGVAAAGTLGALEHSHSTNVARIFPDRLTAGSTSGRG